MSFTEQTFLFIFLPIVIGLYLIASIFKNIKIRNIVIILCNLVFVYLAGLDNFLFYLLITITTHILGNLLYLSKQNDGKVTKWMIAAIAIVLTPLIVSKYLYTFIINSETLSTTFIFSKVIIPLGISYVTFECISYLVDISKGLEEPGSLLDVFMFLSLFPKIMSGPIVLWRDFKPYINERENDIYGGLDRLIIGYAAKVIIADYLGAQILAINQQLETCGIDIQTAWLRTTLYFFQIFFDFAGYSQIAIGLCNIFGFKVKANFNYPYTSTSVSEFWRRWHISLGTWFREYIYIPMGGNRRGNVYLNLFVVFLLTGIWHGANWTFVVWGIMHGIAVCAERYLKDKQWYIKTPTIIKWFLCIVFIYFSWIIFQANNITDAWFTIKSLFVPSNIDAIEFTWRYFLSTKTIIILIISIVFAIVGPFRWRIVDKFINESNTGFIVKRVGLVLLLLVDVVFIVNATYSPFLYFAF